MDSSFEQDTGVQVSRLFQQAQMGPGAEAISVQQEMQKRKQLMK